MSYVQRSTQPYLDATIFRLNHIWTQPYLDATIFGTIFGTILGTIFVLDIRVFGGNMYRKFGFFRGNLRTDPPKPRGDFDNPEGNPPGPRGGAEAGVRRVRARRFAQP